MATTYREQLLEAKEDLARQIQEAIRGNNPGYVKELSEAIEIIEKRLEKVVDVEGFDQQKFNVTSRGCV